MPAIKEKIMAINHSGRIGGFYDAHTDSVTEQPIPSVNVRINENKQPNSGYLSFIDNEQPQNLLKSIMLDGNLMLSVLLNPQPTMGVASLVNYFHLSNKKTVLLHYIRVSHTEQLSENETRTRDYSKIQSESGIESQNEDDKENEAKSESEISGTHKDKDNDEIQSEGNSETRKESEDDDEIHSEGNSETRRESAEDHASENSNEDEDEDDIKSEVKSENTSESKKESEDEDDIKSEVKSENTSESKKESEDEDDIKSEVKSENTSEPKKESEDEHGSESNSKHEDESEDEINNEAKSESKTKMETKDEHKKENETKDEHKKENETKDEHKKENETKVESSSSSTPSALSTHIITAIDWGFEFLALLQLPTDDESVEDIQEVLKKLHALLLNVNRSSALTAEEEKLLEKIVYTKIFTNAIELRDFNKIYDVFQYIKNNSNAIRSYPINYTLRSIEENSAQGDGQIVKFTQVPTEIVHEIEDYLLPFVVDINKLQYEISKKKATLLYEHLTSAFDNLEIQFKNMQENFRRKLGEIFKFVIELRSDRTDASTIQQILNHGDRMAIRTNIDQLKEKINILEEKSHFIKDLLTKNVEYLNVAKCNIDINDDNHSMKTKLLENRPECRILCSYDDFRKSRKDVFEKLMQSLLENKQGHSPVQKIYADFSSTSFVLSNTMILEQLNKTKESLNILLLGETGVGKSTFINAFANYLHFNSLDEARSNPPIAVVPTWFTVTDNIDHQVHVVKYSSHDDSNNERFNQSGQSVTQRCKSYIFKLNDVDGTKVRIIDTPGFGDIRGMKQDERNTQHILEYVNNLTHLNAVCILLKPNTSKLNVFFRTCINQLFSLLNPNSLNNIIFCFTNSRSTLSSPDHTVAQLRQMLNSLAFGDVPFTKENTFCFDSESFRYAVAFRNGISFNETEREAFEMSWRTSAVESNRLINYILRKGLNYLIDRSITSNEAVRITIRHLVRPLLESMRNLLRNFVLLESDCLKSCIQFDAKPCAVASRRCLTCDPIVDIVCGIRIAQDCPHTLKNGACRCGCANTHHVPLHYVLEYKSVASQSNLNDANIIDILTKMLHACAVFAHFLQHGMCSTLDDPFANGIAAILAEENQISNKLVWDHVNRKLVRKLIKLQQVYRYEYASIAPRVKFRELSYVQSWLESIRQYRMVQLQVDTFNQGLKNEVQLNVLEL